MQEDSEEIRFDQAAEEESEEILVSQSIFTDQGDLEVDSLYGRFKRGKLVDDAPQLISTHLSKASV